jgi:hypothetical protein
MSRRQGGWSRPNSHLVTFRRGAAYGRGDERLEIQPGTRLVGMLYDDAEPVLELPAMSLGLSREMVEIALNPDPTLTLRTLAQQSEREAGEALAAGDSRGATARYLEGAIQYRLLDDLRLAEAMQLAARQAHNRFLRTAEGRADFDRHTAEMSDEALRQLGATVRAALRQLGGYQYAPATFAEALAAWDVVRQAVLQVANIDSWNRTHPRAVEPISPATMWVGPDYLADELLTEPKGSPERLAALAETALALDPDDADAHVMLGRLAADRGDRVAARRWYEQGVQAGEGKLGAEYFNDPNRPRFWLAVETRPYMRARSALAHALYKDGELERAIAEFWGMLELNPGDNQGIRYVLSSLLLEVPDPAGFERLHQFMAGANGEAEDGEDDEEAPALNGSLFGDDDEALALDDASPEDDEAPLDPLDPAALNPFESAYWLYPAALYYFQREGDGERARAALALARKQNHHVVALLTGQRRLPAEDPPYYTPGSSDEAALYVKLGRAAWVKTPGALEWVRHKPAAKDAPPPQARLAGRKGVERRGALYDLIAEWVGDDSTYQAAQTKKVYRATLERLAGWLVAQGHPATPAGLTAARIDAYLATLEPEQRGRARNSISVWCDWLVRRGALKQNPVTRVG